MEKIIGTTIVDGMRLGHTRFEVDCLKRLLHRVSPVHFVEIGVHEGALSKLLIEFAERRFGARNLHYLGIEVNCGIVKTRELFTPIHNAELLCADCFSREALDKVRSLKGLKIVYCDGGNKAKELVAYAPLMEFGDVLMAHDFDDGARSGWGLPEKIMAEVAPRDIKFLEEDSGFSQMTWAGMESTRIIAFARL